MSKRVFLTRTILYGYTFGAIVSSARYIEEYSKRITPFAKNPFWKVAAINIPLSSMAMLAWPIAMPVMHIMSKKD